MFFKKKIFNYNKITKIVILCLNIFFFKFELKISIEKIVCIDF